MRNKVDDATTKIHISLDDPGVGDHEFWIWKLHVLVQENTNWVSDPQGEIPDDIWAQYVCPEQPTQTTEDTMSKHNHGTDRTQWCQTITLTTPLLEELMPWCRSTGVRYCFLGAVDRGYPLDEDVVAGGKIYLIDPDNVIPNGLWNRLMGITPEPVAPEPVAPEPVAPEPVAWRPRHLLSLHKTGLNIFVDLGPQWDWIFENTELSRTLMDEYTYSCDFVQSVMIPLYNQALHICGVSVELEAPIDIRSTYHTSEPCGVVMDGASLMDTYAEDLGVPSSNTEYVAFTEVLSIYDTLSPSQQTTLRGLLNNR